MTFKDQPLSEGLITVRGNEFHVFMNQGISHAKNTMHLSI